jgi:hypothetical protein
MVSYYFIFGKTFGLDRSDVRDKSRLDWKHANDCQLPDFPVFTEDEKRLIIDNACSTQLPGVIHLGVNESDNMVFAFHYYRAYYALRFNSLVKLAAILDHGIIVGDDNSRHSAKGFIDIIKNKRSNCKRYKLDGVNCLARGAGAWDFMSEKFFDTFYIDNKIKLWWTG